MAAPGIPVTVLTGCLGAGKTTLLNRIRRFARVEIRVWDSSAQIRWFVLPERPAETDALSEEELAALVTPEAMMGVAKVLAPHVGARP
jgi:hypothetical protein